MNEEDVRRIWDGMGGNATDTAKELKLQTEGGFDESFDGSLHVFYFPKMIVILTCVECIVKHTLE